MWIGLFTWDNEKRASSAAPTVNNKRINDPHRKNPSVIQRGINTIAQLIQIDKEKEKEKR